MKLKEDIFNLGTPDEKDIREIFKDFVEVKLDKITTKKAICHTNETAQQINSILLATNNQGRIKVGDFLLCRKALKNKHFQLFTNYEYIVEKYDGDVFSLLEPYENIRFEIDGVVFVNHFRLNYANTVSSVQGLTIKEPLTIADLGSEMIKKDPRFLWVAITRNENLNDIFVCFNKTCYKVSRLAEKIISHKEEDNKKGFIWKDEDYVNEKWFRDMVFRQRYCCKNCNNAIILDYGFGDDLQYSIDRMDNDLPHIMSNCNIVCYNCNRALK